MFRKEIGRFVALTVLIFAPGCIGPGSGEDFSAKLVGDYYLVRGSEHQIEIGIDGFVEENPPRIPAKIVECAVDRHFILAKRQGLKRRNPNDARDTFEVPDSEVFDYWILNTVERKTFGPMTISDFQAKARELGVTDGIVLRTVESYRDRAKRPH
jgi:hypothetical protein